MEARVVFGNTVDAMMNRALAGRMTPALRERLKLNGFDFDEPIRAGYPYESWKIWADIIAEEIFPELEVGERYRQLGRLVILGIRETTLGKAIEVLLRMIGPRRAMERMNRNYRASDNFTQVVITNLGPKSLQVRLNEAMDQPTYMQGAFEALIEFSGGKDVKVEIREVALPEVTYFIQWS
jgi:uncharacterized protein (TIGR02265 family)